MAIIRHNLTFEKIMNTQWHLTGDKQYLNIIWIYSFILYMTSTAEQAFELLFKLLDSSDFLLLILLTSIIFLTSSPNMSEYSGSLLTISFSWRSMITLALHWNGKATSPHLFFSCIHATHVITPHGHSVSPCPSPPFLYNL